MGVTLPARSKISETFDAQCLRVNLSGIMLIVSLDLFPRVRFEKFNWLILRDRRSSFGNHFIPATLIDTPSSVSDSSGSSPENETPFSLNDARLTTTSISSDRLCA